MSVGGDVRGPNAQLYDVHVQKRRLAAQCALRQACASENLEEILNALITAKAAGVIQPELDDALAAATRIRSTRKAREALEEALELQDEGSLRQAVTLADKACLHNEQLEKATALLETIETQAAEQVQECDGDGPEPETPAQMRKQTLERLEKALHKRGQRELMEAIAEAESAGLACKKERSLLAQARVMLNIVNARKEVAARRRARESGEEDGAGRNLESCQTWTCPNRELSLVSVDSTKSLHGAQSAKSLPDIPRTKSLHDEKLQLHEKLPTRWLEREDLIPGEPPRGG
jgi:hypothetical protein